MAILPVGISGEAGAYQIERSLRFNSADSAYLSRTPASAGSLTTWTYSTWVKRSTIDAGQRLLFAWQGTSGTIQTHMMFQSNNTILFEVYNDPTDYKLITTQVFRDPSAWYHIVAVYDSTNATSGDRMRLYVNGSRITAFGTAAYPSQNYQGVVNNTNAHNIGRRGDTGAEYFTGYMADTYLIDGSALDPSSFGETDTDTGVWKPKAYSGSYGTNGFYLDFGDNSSTTALGYDAAGSNDWTPNNFSVTAGTGNDSLVDSPTRYGTDTGVGGEVRGNYCTMNPLGVPSNYTYKNGNLDIDFDGSTDRHAISTFAVTSGVYYFEGVMTARGSSSQAGFCVVDGTKTWNTADATAIGRIEYRETGLIGYNNSFTSGYSTFTTNDVIGVWIDATNGSVKFYKNNTLIYTQTGMTFGSYMPAYYANGGTSRTSSATLNFGQRAFAYTAPSSAKALCTTNLPEPTIAEGADHFGVLLYTGDNTSNRDITGLNFTPDFTWIKPRSIAGSHGLFDAVRGASKSLRSHDTRAEDTSSAGSDLDSFISGGIRVDPSSFIDTNTNGATTVAWNWKANGAGSSNTAGTISSTVSANTTAGFSVVTYTGTGSNATVGHGLGVAPAMIIVKNRGTTTDWAVYHKSLTSAAYWLELNSSGGVSGPNSVVFNSTAPTSTVFSVGTNDRTNATNSYVAYCFSEVPGYSSMGSYTGNLSTDGPFIFTGFRPRFVMGKRTDSSGDWFILDAARSTYNQTNVFLYPHSSAAEGANAYQTDFLSNGFKLRNVNTQANASGGTYVYMAFAENPFSISLAR
jgi:hypothetical protein